MKTETSVLARRLKQTLREGKASLGAWMSMGHVSIAEILAAADYDWVVIETEHTSIDVSEVLRLLIAIEGRGTVPLVRLAGVDPLQAKAVLDAGAAGILVPLVNSREDAERVVDSAKYPPLGRRGVGVARAQGYGATFHDYLAHANDDTLVMLQIEHIDAVNCIEEIVSVPGIDGTFIGPYDLSASMGLTGQFDHPDVQAAQRRVLDVTHAAGLVSGIHLVQPRTALAELPGRLAEGYRFVALCSDLFLLVDASRTLATAARAVVNTRSHS